MLSSEQDTGRYKGRFDNDFVLVTFTRAEEENGHQANTLPKVVQYRTMCAEAGKALVRVDETGLSEANAAVRMRGLSQNALLCSTKFGW